MTLTAHSIGSPTEPFTRLGSSGRAWAPIASTPVTFAYLAILAVTSLVLGSLERDVSQAVLAAHSTTLANLAGDAPTVLVSSAFLLDGADQLLLAAVVLTALRPLEARIGARRWIAAFAAGHVGATLITAGLFSLALAAGVVGEGIESGIDVGFSYGALALVGLATTTLTRRRRRIAIRVGVVALIVAGALPGGMIAGCGHLSAFALGHLLTSLRRPAVTPEMLT